jgi:hypothetical protein
VEDDRVRENARVDNKAKPSLLATDLEKASPEFWEGHGQ